MNKPVSWDTFKELGKKTQEEYIHNLMAVYGANATSLAAMFDVRPLTVRRYLAAKELNVSFPVGRSMNAEQKAAWEDFLNEAVSVQEIPIEYVPANEQPKEAVQEQKPQMNMKKVTLSFSGKIDVNAIANSLIHILGTDTVGDIEIVCNLA